MKTKLLLSALILLFPFSFLLSPCTAQVPMGFNYQAIARDGGGAIIANTALPVKITIQTSTGTVIYEELFSSVTSNQFGLISLVVGTGAWQSGSAPSFSAIDWKAQTLFLKTTIQYPGTTWTTMGTSQIWAVPYSLAAKEVTGPLSKLGITGTTDVMDEALFEVKNKAGNTVFAVYNEGIRAYVGNGSAKGVKGGFSVGGYDATKSGTVYDIFVLSTDSARFYLDSKPQNGTKGVKGGFSVGGYDMTKAGPTIQNYLAVSKDSVRIYIDSNPSTKGVKGGFSVGGYDMTKSGTPVSNYLNVETNASGIINPSQNRILWYPLKNAFLTGRVRIGTPDSVGVNSFATGYESKSRGMYSQAMGYKAVANGDYSTAIGKNALAGKDNSFAFGEGVIASSNYAYAFGKNAQAQGTNSYAFGENATVTYQNSYAFGRNASVSNISSYAIGENSNASGIGSYSLGIGAIAQGKGSFAFGSMARDAEGNITGLPTKAIGDNSFALGSGNIASGASSTCLGSNNTSSGANSLSAGYYSKSSGNNSFAMGQGANSTGESSTAMGIDSYARDYCAFAFGYRCEANGSYSIAVGAQSLAKWTGCIAMGMLDTATTVSCTAIGAHCAATGYASTALGFEAKAKGSYSVALGVDVLAKGAESVAIGSGSQATGTRSIGLSGGRASGANALAIGGNYAKGYASLSSGFYTVAEGDASIAHGYYTVSNSYASLVIGRCNDTSICYSKTAWDSRDPAFIVGNGADRGHLSNAFAVYKNGNAYLQGGLQVANSSGPITANWWEFGVDNGGGTGIDFHSNTSAVDFSSRIYRTPGNNGDFQIVNTGTGGLDFQTGGADRMYINSSGNIGIGTNAPSERLDVRGTIRNTVNTNYDVWIQGGAVTSGTGRNLALLGEIATDKLYLNYGGEYTGGTIVGGNVGIGTTSPLSRLHIEDANPVLTIRPTGGVLGEISRIDMFGTFNLTADMTPRNFGSIEVGCNAGSTWGGAYVRIMARKADANTYEAMRVDNWTGNVGIGTTAPGYKLQVNGLIAGVGAYVNTSDARFKKDIEPISGALEKIMALQGISFNWDQKGDSGFEFDSRNHLGFSAQDLEKVVPQVVYTANDKMQTKSVAYGDLVPLLTEAIKEQQKVIDSQNNKIRDLESRLEKVEALIK